MLAVRRPASGLRHLDGLEPRSQSPCTFADGGEVRRDFGHGRALMLDRLAFGHDSLSIASTSFCERPTCLIACSMASCISFAWRVTCLVAFSASFASAFTSFATTLKVEDQIAACDSRCKPLIGPGNGWRLETRKDQFPLDLQADPRRQFRRSKIFLPFFRKVCLSARILIRAEGRFANRRRR